jgi:fumarate reductase flavoprotein subunit
MKKGIIGVSISFIWVLTFVCLFGVHSNLALAAESSNLGDKHKNAGVDCKSCHKEAPPSYLVPMQICLECHGGDYEKLAEQTTKVAPNPHDSHLGKAPCEFCHHAHKPSEYYCAKCHILDSKVP